MICPGVIEKIEDGNQDIQDVTALQDKEEEFLGMREGTGGLGQCETGSAPPCPT